MPQTRATAQLAWSTHLEGRPFVDSEGTAFFPQGCRLSDGTEKQTPLPGSNDWVIGDPSGIGVYSFEQGYDSATGLTKLTAWRTTCGGTSTNEGSASVDISNLGFYFEPAYIDESHRACFTTGAGVLCWALPSGTPEFAATSEQVRALLPPASTLHDRAPNDLAADVRYGAIETFSSVRSLEYGRTFMAIRVELKTQTGPFDFQYAKALVELSSNGLRLVEGPDYLPGERATNLDKLFLDSSRKLLFAEGGVATHAVPVLGGNGERYLVPPALNVYPIDGSPGAGTLNWSTYYQELCADLAPGAPRPRVIATSDGIAIRKDKPNPRADSGVLLFQFQIDWDRIDLDEDGLPAKRERELGTSDLLADSDGGGISDSFEVARGTNPLSSADDNFTKGTLPREVDYSVSGLASEATLPPHYFIGGGLRPGKLFCSTMECYEKMRERFDELQLRTLTADGKAVVGFAKERLVVRSFDGTERLIGTFPTTGLLVSFSDGRVLLVRDGTYTVYSPDGSNSVYDLNTLVCPNNECSADAGNIALSIIGLDRETEWFRLVGRGNEEIFTFLWHPDRGVRLVGRNSLMISAGNLSTQLFNCQFTPEGACLADYLVSGGNSFPAIVHGQTGRAWSPFRMLTNGYPQDVAWDTSFTGFATLDTGTIINTEWVRMEDRIEPGDVLTMEGRAPGEVTRKAHLYRVGKRGAMLPLYDDSYDPDPLTSQTHFPDLPPARGIGAAADGRICLVGVDGKYREMASPNERRLPQTIGVAEGVDSAIDCGFDEAGRAHILAANPSRLIIFDSRLSNPLVETIPLSTTNTSSQLTVGPGETDVVAQTNDKFLCLNTTTKTVTTSQVVGAAAAVSAQYGSFILDDRYNPTKLKGSVCEANPWENVILGREDVGTSQMADLLVRPDGRLVATGSRQVIVAPIALVDTAIQSRALVGPIALVPGGTWTDPWAESVVEPDFNSHEGPGDGEEDGKGGDPKGGCDCADAPAGWLALGLFALRWRRRPRT